MKRMIAVGGLMATVFGLIVVLLLIALDHLIAGKQDRPTFRVPGDHGELPWGDHEG